METPPPQPLNEWTSIIPPDVWTAAVLAMPWFYPPRHRKRLQIEWHVRFLPPDENSSGFIQAVLNFQSIEQLINTRLLDVHRKVYELYNRRQNRVLKIATAVNQMGKSPEDDKRAVAIVRRMRLAQSEKESIFNEVKDLLGGQLKRAPATPPDVPPHRTLSAINRDSHLLERVSVMDNLVEQLQRSAINGDTTAARHLQGIAKYATMQLSVAARIKPEVFRPLAEETTLWPVMASTNPHWPRTAEQMLLSLDFGVKTLHAKVKPKLAFDRYTPARRWAKVALEVLEVNRLRFADPKAPDRYLVLLKCDHDVRLRSIPHWAIAAGQLPPFTRQTAKKWAFLSREMIRSEIPQLERHSDWTSITRRFEHLANNGGLVRNKVLDAIGSALCSLAREALPKTNPGISATKKR